jgi:hypothetical protein
VPDTGASTVCRLGEEPIAAGEKLLERLALDARSAAPEPVVAIGRS